MTITDKQVEAACVAYVGGNDAFRSILSSGREGLLNDMRAALEAAEAARDAGDFVLVPREPTVAMQDEGSQAANAEHGRHDCSSIGYGHAEAVYRAMIAAAPSSAEQPEHGDEEFREWFAGATVRTPWAAGREAMERRAAAELAQMSAPGAPEADERGIVGLTRDLASCERALERRTIERNAFAAELDACSQYLKPGERVVDRIARELRDSASLLEMLATERAALEAARAQASASPSVAPVAFVPVHPVTGPLWADAYSAEAGHESRSLSYERMPLYAAPVSARDGDTFFSYGDDHGGFETHGSAAEARAAAEESLGYFRDDAPEGWNDGVRNVCWGVILGEVVETESRPSTPDDPCYPDCSHYVDYELRDCAAPPADARDGCTASLPWNADVAEILGKPNFWCGPLANLLRFAGESIPAKAEAEQAAVIYWLLGRYFEHGSDWRRKADEWLGEVSAQVRAARASAKPADRAMGGE